MVIFGFPSDARTLQPVAAVATVGPALLQAAGALLALRPAGPTPRSQLLAMLDRGILKAVKTLSQVQEAHPWSLHAAGVLRPALELCVDRIACGLEPATPSAERIVMQARAPAAAASRDAATRPASAFLSLLARSVARPCPSQPTQPITVFPFLSQFRAPSTLKAHLHPFQPL